MDLSGEFLPDICAWQQLWQTTAEPASFWDLFKTTKTYIMNLYLISATTYIGWKVQRVMVFILFSFLSVLLRVIFTVVEVSVILY